jgi:hypothetical protein
MLDLGDNEFLVPNASVESGNSCQEHRSQRVHNNDDYVHVRRQFAQLGAMRSSSLIFLKSLTSVNRLSPNVPHYS